MAQSTLWHYEGNLRTHPLLHERKCLLFWVILEWNDVWLKDMSCSITVMELGSLESDIYCNLMLFWATTMVLAQIDFALRDRLFWKCLSRTSPYPSFYLRAICCQCCPFKMSAYPLPPNNEVGLMQLYPFIVNVNIIVYTILIVNNIEKTAKNIHMTLWSNLSPWV